MPKDLIKKLFSKFRFRDYVMWWQGESGKKTAEQLITQELSSQGVPYLFLYDFFREHGTVILELQEKYIVEKMKTEAFAKMNTVQAAFLGLEAFQMIMTQIIIEKEAADYADAKKELQKMAKTS